MLVGWQVRWWIVVTWVAAGLLAGRAEVTVEPPVAVQFRGPAGGALEPWFVVPAPASAPSMSAAPSAAAAAEAEFWTRQGQRLAEYRRPDAATRGERTVTLLRGATRYPLRVETVHDGAGRVVACRAVAAEHLLVQLRPGVSARELARVAARHGATVRRALYRHGCYLVQAPPGGPEALPALYAALRAEPAALASVEYDEQLRLALTPTDPSYEQLWGLHNTGQLSGTIAGTPGADIDAERAWNLTTGSSAILVGVVDTGIDYHHPDLAANLWINPGEIAGNGVDDDANGLIDDVRGWNFANDTSDPFDNHRHGTHVAGTLGAIASNGQGVVGVAHQVRMVPIKFLNASGTGNLSDAVDSLTYATRIGCRVINNSWTGGNTSAALLAAAQDAYAAGFLITAAAGNQARNNDTIPIYPANLDVPGVISIAATTAFDTLATFSNFGATQVDLAAPGDNILSTFPNGQYSRLNGTSMATPHVSGALVLLMAHQPDLTADQLMNRLYGTVDRVPALAGKVRTGGRLNAYRLLTDRADALTLTNPDAGEVAWTATSDQPWVSLVPAAGTVPGTGTATATVALTAAAADLTIGSYTATISLALAGQGTVSRQVRLTVQSTAGSHLEISPTAWATGGPAGGPFSPTIQQIEVRNVGIAPMQVAVTPAAAWVVASPSQFGVLAGSSRMVTLSLAATALTVGSYTQEVAFTNQSNGAGSTALTATLAVTPAPVLAVTPATGWAATGAAGGPFAPSSQSYDLSNSVSASGELAWTAGTDVPWLTLSATAGTLAAAAATTAGVTVSLNAAAAALAPGTYTGTVTLANATNGQGTASRAVVLTVLRPAELVVEPQAALHYSGLPGGPFLPFGQVWVVSNPGELPLAWSAVADLPWVTLGSAGGALAAGEATGIPVSPQADATPLTPGLYTATIAFTNTANGLGDTTRLLVLEVLRPARLAVSPGAAWTARGVAGGTIAPATFTWLCHNAGDRPLTLELGADQPWLALGMAASPPYQIASGETLPVTLTLTDTASLPPGTHAGIVTFINTTTGQGDTFRDVVLTLGTPGPAAIYRLSLRGERDTEGGPLKLRRQGHLVVDRANRLVTAILTGKEDRIAVAEALPWQEQHLQWSVLPDGDDLEEHLAGLSRQVGEGGLTQLAAYFLHGEVEEAELPGPLDLPRRYRGTWVQGDRRIAPTLVATFTARLDRQASSAANDAQREHDLLVADYLAVAVAEGAQNDALLTLPEPDFALAAPLGYHPLFCYQLTVKRTATTAAAVAKSTRRGLLVYSRPAQQALLAESWEDDDDQRYYQVTALGPDALLATLVAKRTTWSERLLFAPAASPALEVTCLHGRCRTVPDLGGGIGLVVPKTLKGQRWRVDEAGGRVLVDKLTARFDKKRTLPANAGNQTLADVVNTWVAEQVADGAIPAPQ